MSALDVLRQIKLSRKTKGAKKIIEWGNAEHISEIGVENLSRKDLRNHLEARDLETTGTRLELIERLRISIADEQLHKFAYQETQDAEFLIQADLEERGSVYVCGKNDKGQLGVGDIHTRKLMTVIPQMRGVNTRLVIAGVDLTYALTEDFTVFVWGGGGVGRTAHNPKGPRALLGAGGQPNWMEPSVVFDLSGEECVQVAMGASHCLACAKGGDCFVWGDGTCGQLGLGHFDNHPTVAINNSFSGIVQVCCGSNHSVALTQKGEVYSWGHAANGRLGVGASERIGVPEKERQLFPVPTRLVALEQITQIACGADHTLAIGASGVWAWGSGAGYKLGLNDQKDRYDPVLVPRLKEKIILQVSAGAWHSMCIVLYPPMMGGGVIYTWGSGYHGQLAQGTKQICQTPEPVEYFYNVHLLIKQISAGDYHCAAVTREGELYTWGSNRYNCLGRKIQEKDVEYTPIPGHVGGFGAIVGRIGRGLVRSVACGREYTIVATWPYEGPNFEVCTKLMEEQKVRQEEANLIKQQNVGLVKYDDDSMG
mmetsp:Transcript_17850/g.18611  ORF Transcript_17850/g.18611 Transcript_17850/m.18611 type:complete len:539 (-) Transcript_17850:79-1695(-)